MTDSVLGEAVSHPVTSLAGALGDVTTSAEAHRYWRQIGAGESPVQRRHFASAHYLFEVPYCIAGSHNARGHYRVLSLEVILHPGCRISSPHSAVETVGVPQSLSYPLSLPGLRWDCPLETHTPPPPPPPQISPTHS